jgi:hypothetical protein
MGNSFNLVHLRHHKETCHDRQSKKGQAALAGGG